MTPQCQVSKKKEKEKDISVLHSQSAEDSMLEKKTTVTT